MDKLNIVYNDEALETVQKLKISWALVALGSFEIFFIHTMTQNQDKISIRHNDELLETVRKLQIKYLGRQVPSSYLNE